VIRISGETPPTAMARPICAFPRRRYHAARKRTRSGRRGATLANLILHRDFTIDWGHCDPAGIVFNARYFEFFDSCTWQLFETGLGLKKSEIMAAFDVIGFPAVEARARFMAAAKFGDRVEIASQIREFRRSSFDVEHHLHVGGRLAVECIETRVWTGRDPDDPKRMKSKPITPDIIARFTSA
jgi:4-hydroxybenzoyl-CoA thioesterase